MFNDILANKYRVLGQTPPAAGPLARGFPAPAPAAPAALSVSRNGETVGTPTDTFGKGGLFGTVPVGGTGTYRGFTATNSGPGLPQVISSSGTPFGMMDLLRTQGYTPEEATRAVGIGSAAGLDTVNAGLRPGESAANIALNRANAAQAQAQGGYLTAQTGQVAPIARADIAYKNAQAGFTNAQTDDQRVFTDYHHLHPDINPATGQPYVDPATGLPAAIPQRPKRRGLGGLTLPEYNPLRQGAP